MPSWEGPIRWAKQQKTNNRMYGRCMWQMIKGNEGNKHASKPPVEGSHTPKPTHIRGQIEGKANQGCEESMKVT